MWGSCRFKSAQKGPCDFVKNAQLTFCKKIGIIILESEREVTQWQRFI